ncbi:conserved exported hypothetical protein [Cupriavidus phytorum]|uniref:Uncharacterized protein n=1 Tax=Cupriavidus taiwanensis TaxID=164546 RepID=A0A375C3G9_9BURK|nr:hypothetical protein [Cupriavidus taiwanensis]SOY62193.1 conserved exported hypothetical protein [Cupriavidus taiwanensis]
MRRALLLTAAVAVAFTARAETMADILRAGKAAEAALQAQMEAEERAVWKANEDAIDSTVVWTCSCVNGHEIWGFKTIKQIRAESQAKARRSQALFDAYPKMSTQLNSQLTNRCQ